MSISEYARVLAASDDETQIERWLGEIVASAVRVERHACAVIAYEAYVLLESCPDGDDCCGRAASVDVANAILSRGRRME